MFLKSAHAFKSAENLKYKGLKAIKKKSMACLTVNKKCLVFLLLLGFFLIVALVLIDGYYRQKHLVMVNKQQISPVIKDRNGNVLAIIPNQRGYFCQPLDDVPLRVRNLLIKKEDRLFYYHFGINPISIIEATLGRIGIEERKASSTITQQLVKILLGHEKERNLRNKITEVFYTLALETFQGKEKILQMYINSIYFGNQAQGITEASRLYFGKDPAMLTDGQILQLLATISSPTENNPAENSNKEIVLALAKRLGLDKKNLIIVDSSEVKKNLRNFSHFDDAYFELKPFLANSEKNCRLTVDKELTEKIRSVVKRNIDELKTKNARNAAVLVIKLPENEILSLIGSPDPRSYESGYKIDMLTEPRPIGSTIKPFIYLKAFGKGLRPYTIVDDREYKYITAIGFPLFPKNFDYKYHGEVSLHYALSNSLNVPAVKVLEYVGLDDFYKFLEKDLEFKPVQPLSDYQLGIALGSLEMSLFDLARYFTIFPNKGILKSPLVDKDGDCFKASANNQNSKQIAQTGYIQLINKILSDRKTGIEQFGLKSELNLFQDNYALKTGTSKDFKDSWVIGYTPDFLVGVWVGNADASPTDEVSGQTGAGMIWATIMEVLLNSSYNKKTPFEFNLLKEFNENGNIDYGFNGDDYENTKNILKERDTSLILFPHDGDVFLLEKGTKIPLKAKGPVSWFINEKLFDQEETSVFVPAGIGYYQIKAVSPSQEEIITIMINREI